MSSFTEDLITRVLDVDAYLRDRAKGATAIPAELYDGRHFQVMKEFDYCVGAKGSKEIIHVHKGFITDFASIPQIFWNILPPTGKYGKAAVVHDFLYQTLGLGGKYSRKRCDEILLEAMVPLQVGWLTRRTIYTGVRLGGGWTWEKYEKKQTTHVLWNQALVRTRQWMDELNN